MLLVDTSVWIEVFRKPARLALEKHIDFDEVVTCLPVVQEVLQGFKDERAYAIARESMYALPMIDSPLTDRVVDQAVELALPDADGRRRQRYGGVLVVGEHLLHRVHLDAEELPVALFTATE